MNYFYIGLIIGGIVGIPMGTVATLAAQNVKNYGIKEGVITGFGFSLAYLFMATIDVIIVAILGKYLVKVKNIISIAAAICFIIIGIIRVIKREDDFDTDNSNKSHFMNMITAFMAGFTNQIVTLEILFWLVYFGIKGMNFTESLSVIGGCECSMIAWWVIFSILMNIACNITEIKSMKKYNIFMGAVLAGLGIWVISR